MFINFYRILSAVSLDVVAGACILCAFISSYVGVELTLIPMLGLAISLWVIYTTDHLIDAKKINHSASTFRHRFHQKHFKAILCAVIMVGLVGICIIPFIPRPTFIAGVIIALIVLIYFLVLGYTRNRLFYYFKDITVALVYTAGVFVVPLTAGDERPDFGVYFLFFQISLLALSNLLVFSLFEIKQDQQDGHASLGRLLGPQRTQNLSWIALLSSLVFILLALIFFKGWLEIQMNILIMNVILMFVL